MFPGPVCVSLTPNRAADLFRAPIDGADCIEARLDYLDEPEESSMVRWSDLPVPAIATCRGRDRGGRFDGSIEEELRILGRAVENGAQYVDVDFRFAKEFPTAGVIGSYHDFDSTPEDLEDLLDAVCRSPVSVAKVATMVRSWTDNRRLLALLDRSWPKPVVVVGMGPMGQITRVIGPSRGSALTYTSSGEKAAPGQLALDELLDTYRFRQIGGGTRIIGIVGNPVDHSASPALHNRAFEASGLDYVYLKFPVDAVDDFFGNLEQIGIDGFSVTIPHKIAIMRFLDKVSPEAQAVGAVNTVYREDSKWIGDNTDVHGIRAALKDFDPRGKSVLIIGTGGAARAAVAALDEAASITLLSRTRKEETLEWSRRVPVDSLENSSRYDVDLLINASPVGMSPDVHETPVSGPIGARLVFDMVYSPLRTRLLREAEAQGKQTISGMVMLVAQAARQFEIWTKHPAPQSVFEVESL